jgi:Flp pilus assembly secretin CpaC
LLWASHPSDRLYQEAEQAENNGLSVRAYLLYSQLATQEPQNQLYVLKAAALKPLALKKVNVSVPSLDREGAGTGTGSGGVITDQDTADAARMAGPVHLQAQSGTQDFHIKAAPKSIWEQVAGKLGLVAIFDRDYPTQQPLRFDVDEADYRLALHALEAATNSFVVPISPRVILVAQDTTQKRTELESNEAAMIPIPDNTSVQEAQEMATMIQQTIEMRRFVVDAHKRMIFMRDRVSKVEAAKLLTAQLLHAKPQVNLEVKFLTVTRSSALTLGLNLPTSFPLVYLGNWKNAILKIPSGFTHFLTFGGGATLFGIGLSDIELFATASRSSGTLTMNANIAAADGQAATLHVGDKYPIVTAQYSGAPTGTTGGQVIVPPPVFNFEDLGVILKVTPTIHDEDEVSLDLSAEYKVLGATNLNGIPTISNRKFEAKVRLMTSQCAIVSGLVNETHSDTRSGVAFLSRIPLLGWFFRKTEKEHDFTQTLLVLTPHIVIPPPSAYLTREIWIGPDTKPLTPL